MPPSEEVLAKVGSLPDLADMDKDSLAALVKELYDRSCQVFSDHYDVKQAVQVKLNKPNKNDLHEK